MGSSFAPGVADTLEERTVTIMQQISTDDEFYCPRKSGEEHVRCSWAPDGSTFAWSLGTRMVFLMTTESHYTHFCSRNSEPYNLLKNKESVKEKRFFECPHPVTSLAFGCRSSDNRWHPEQVRNRLQKFSRGKLMLAAGLSNGDIIIWDTDTCRIVLILRDHRQRITDLAFTYDGSLVLASCSKDCTVKLWDLMDDGNMFKTLEGHPKMVNALAWSPNNIYLASVGVGRAVMIWNIRTESLERKLEGHQNDVTSCGFSPDGALLFTGSCDTTVICFDVNTGMKKAIYSHMFPNRPIFAGGSNGHEVRDISVSKDGVHFASSCHDGFLRIWKIYDPSAPIQVLNMEDQRAMKFSDDGFVLALCCRSGAINFLVSPMKISSLQHACRLVIRRHSGRKCSDLHVPRKVSAFLNYSDIL